MSTPKRARRREPGAPSASNAKRLKSSHISDTSGLDVLVNDDTRAGKKLEARLTNGVSHPKASHVNESHVATAPAELDHLDFNSSANEGQQQPGRKVESEVINISSGEDELSDDSSDDEEEANGGAGISAGNTNVTRGKEIALTNGSHQHEQLPEETGAADVEMGDVADLEDVENATEEKAEISFGDMLQARHPDPVDVQQSLKTTDDDNGARIATTAGQMVPQGHSLGVTLAQALKNNDKDMLEACFKNLDLSTIRSTIERQKSADIGILLQRIAERIHNSPGRTGPLMVWIQWSLVAHGAYLANQPELMKNLKSLAQVVRERASGLQPLLHLKGKLDLLGAQLELRQKTMSASRIANTDALDDPAGVTYVEGRDDDWSDSDDGEDAEHAASRARVVHKGKSRQQSADESEEDGLPNGLPNGVSHHSEDESSAEEEANGMLDAEAEEGFGDEDDNIERNLDNEEVSEDEEEEEEEDDEDEDEESADDDDDDLEGSEIMVKQPKLSTLNRKR